MGQALVFCKILIKQMGELSDRRCVGGVGGSWKLEPPVPVRILFWCKWEILRSGLTVDNKERQDGPRPFQEARAAFRRGKIPTKLSVGG